MTASATTSPHVTRIPIAASAMALGAGVVWSFGAVTARMAKHADAFQYLIWRSVGVLVVMEVMAALRREPTLLLKAYTSGKWMLSADFGLLLASFMFIYAVKTTTAANASFLGSVTPLAAVVLARFVLGERLSRVTLGAIVVATVGSGRHGLRRSARRQHGRQHRRADRIGRLRHLHHQRALQPEGRLVAGAVGIRGGDDRAVLGHHARPRQDAVPTGKGHGTGSRARRGLHRRGNPLFNRGSRSVAAVPMTVFAQTEMVFVPLWVFLVLGDAPKAATVVGGAIIFAAVVGKAMLDTSPGAVQPVQEC